MHVQLTCRNGHQWESREGQVVCPMCGSAAEADAAATLTLMAEAATVPPAAKPDHGARPPEVPPFLTDHPRYRVQELLGRGGMGAVYKAQHLLMQRTVALKVISENLTGNHDAIQRFLREVQAVARLSHRSIVAAYDAEQCGDAHFLVMEYVPGKSIARILAEQGPIPVATACEWICQAAEGLHHAHVNGHVHRDIKPQNLMVTPEGQVKILDFGLARLVTEAMSAEAPVEAAPSANTPGEHSLAGVLTRAGSVMGTPDCMAPEQADDSRRVDIRADIYSLGCTFYHLLTGTTPFRGDSILDKLLAHQVQTPKPIAVQRSEVPPAVIRVVERMMAKRPEERWATPSDVVRALEPWRVPTATAADAVNEPLAALPVAAPTVVTVPPPAPLPSKPKRRGRFFLGCIGVILISLLGCAGVATWLVHYTTNKVKEFATFFKDRANRDEVWQMIEQNWQAPAATSTPEALFPRSVGSYTRTHYDNLAQVEELQLDREGMHAVYRHVNKQLEFFVYLVPESEREELFERAKNTVEANKKAVHLVQSSGSATGKRFGYVNGSWHGAMWWSAGWLFVVRSQEDDDPEQSLITLVRALGVKPSGDTKTKIGATPKKTKGK